MAVSQILGRLMFAGAALVGFLPLPLARWLGAVSGRLAHALGTREAKVARRNLELIAPELDARAREGLVGEILRATGRNLLETLRVWTHKRGANLRLVRAVHGVELLDRALADGRGLIVSAPHYGNWELLIQYLASRAPFSLVYRVPEKAAGDVFLRLARGGPNVRLVPAETNAMRPLWKALKEGGMVGITPDQQPKFGGGEFAPFFGRQALTLSLIPRLAERSGAPVVFAWAEPVPGGFDIRFEQADPRIADPDLVVATTAMNAQVEAIARRDLRQYQWTYKRYSRRPRGSGEKNPYYPDCY
ncbi:lipid A biosynthesis lauroyl acyltransferase [Arenimonas sp.]|uniref:LpxL/LpxP family acyltransferase n=1 Tax=Arenimonas sp. TaxID=1872635 RepID=UPI0039E54564